MSSSSKTAFELWVNPLASSGGKKEKRQTRLLGLTLSMLRLHFFFFLPKITGNLWNVWRCLLSSRFLFCYSFFGAVWHSYWIRSDYKMLGTRRAILVPKDFVFVYLELAFCLHSRKPATVKAYGRARKTKASLRDWPYPSLRSAAKSCIANGSEHLSLSSFVPSRGMQPMSWKCELLKAQFLSKVMWELSRCIVHGEYGSSMYPCIS